MERPLGPSQTPRGHTRESFSFESPGTFRKTPVVPGGESTLPRNHHTRCPLLTLTPPESDSCVTPLLPISDRDLTTLLFWRLASPQPPTPPHCLPSILPPALDSGCPAWSSFEELGEEGPGASQNISRAVQTQENPKERTSFSVICLLERRSPAR